MYEDSLRNRLLKDFHGLRQGPGMSLTAVRGARNLLALPCIRVLGPAEKVSELALGRLLSWIDDYRHSERREAIQNAFAIDVGSTAPSKLTQRRVSLSARKDIPIQGVRDREDAAISDLIDALLEDCVDLADKLLMNVQTSSLNPDPAESVGDTYRDVEVSAILSAGPSEQYVALSLTVSARVPDELWIVAITHDEFLAERLCAFSPAINEVVCPGPLGTAVERDMELLVYSGSVIHSRPTRVAFQPLAGDEVERLTGLEGLSSLPDISWFGADLTRAGHALTRIAFTYTQVLHVTSRYCFWTAPRKCELSRLIFDIAQFPDRVHYHFSLRPFLGVPATVIEGDKSFELRVDLPVERGHGAALVWGDPRP